jgi:Flp pilus assembly protein TadG
VPRLCPLRRVQRIDDDGSAVVEFVVIIPVFLLVLLAVTQVTLALHVRATLASAAAEGARVAALSGSNSIAGERRVRAVLAGNVAADVIDTVRVRARTTAGLRTIDVEVRARIPLIGLLGPTALVVHGHALAEP